MDKGNGGVEAFRNAARDATSLYKGNITPIIELVSSELNMMQFRDGYSHAHQCKLHFPS